MLHLWQESDPPEREHFKDIKRISLLYRKELRLDPTFGDQIRDGKVLTSLTQLSKQGQALPDYSPQKLL